MSTKDFTTYKYHRFPRAEAHVYAPSLVLHVGNIPECSYGDVEKLKAHFATAATAVEEEAAAAAMAAASTAVATGTAGTAAAAAAAAVEMAAAPLWAAAAAGCSVAATWPTFLSYPTCPTRPRRRPAALASAWVRWCPVGTSMGRCPAAKR